MKNESKGFVEVAGVMFGAACLVLAAWAVIGVAVHLVVNAQ